MAALRPQKAGLRRGENFWLRLTTASAQCLRLSERFFIELETLFADEFVQFTGILVAENDKMITYLSELLRRGGGVMPLTVTFSKLQPLYEYT